jgi:excisionase family DNA binding protein
MLNHEWTRQRDRRIRQTLRETRPLDGLDAEAEAEVEVEVEVEAETGVGAEAEDEAGDEGLTLDDLTALEDAGVQAARDREDADLSPEPAPEAPLEALAQEPLADDAPLGLEAPAPEAEPVALAEEPSPAPARAPDPREVVEHLEVPLAGLRERLQAVLARQIQLPLDIEARRDVSEQVEGSPRETREILLRRLLDPTLTLEETALLLGVCPTTVRRYTNRGVLACYRTPGNQRRFHLTDILDFMERQSTPRA